MREPSIELVGGGSWGAERRVLRLGEELAKKFPSEAPHARRRGRPPRIATPPRRAAPARDSALNLSPYTRRAVQRTRYGYYY